MAFRNLHPLPLPLEKWNHIAAAMKLPPQQKRIVELILRNCRDQQIAVELKLKVPTVRTHLQRIFQRLKVQDRIELVLLIFAISHQGADLFECNQK